jgi:hypothetical protein
MYTLWKFLLGGKIHFFVPRFPAYAKAIKDAAITKAGVAVFQHGAHAVCCFIDYNTSTARPDGEPSSPDVGAQRNPIELQVQYTAPFL